MRVELYPAGIRAVLNEAPAREALRGRAKRTVDDAKQSGPRNPFHKTHVIDKLAVGDDRATEDGAVVDILWDSPVWHLLEFGTQHYPPYRLVTRGAQNAGLRVIERQS